MARDGHECGYCGSKPFELCSLSCRFTSARPAPGGGEVSPCPKCGAERGMHLRLVVPWNPGLPVLIDHLCRSSACRFLWSEVATTPEGALKSALENRGNAPLAGFGNLEAK